MKTIFRLLIILIVTVLFVNVTLSTKVYALDGMIGAGKNFLEAGSDDAINEESLKTVSQTIYNIFLAVAIGIAVIVGAYLGIKIMIGTIEEKAKIKEMLIPYIVGVTVIFMAFLIWSTVVKIGTFTVGTGKYTGTQIPTPTPTPEPEPEPEPDPDPDPLPIHSPTELPTNMSELVDYIIEKRIYEISGYKDQINSIIQHQYVGDDEVQCNSVLIGILIDIQSLIEDEDLYNSIESICEDLNEGHALRPTLNYSTISFLQALYNKM